MILYWGLEKEAIMKASEIRKVVEEQCEERGRHLGMPRDALGDVFCEEGFATIVTGVRRCGKSTLLNQWADSREGKIVSVHFDDLRLAAFETSDFSLLDGVDEIFRDVPVHVGIGGGGGDLHVPDGGARSTSMWRCGSIPTFPPRSA